MNRYLRAPCLSVDRAVPLCVALAVACQRAKHWAASPTRGAGLGASALWLSAPAHSDTARRSAGQPQADLSPVPGRRVDGYATEEPPGRRGGARTSEPTERTEPGLVDGLRLRRTQHEEADQMPDGG